MKKWLLLFALPFFVFSKPIYLLDKLKNTHEGDYFSLQTGKNATLLHIQKKTLDLIVLEEISFSAKKQPKNVQKYLDQLAPHHSSWTQTQFDLKNIKVSKCYSFVQKSFVDGSNFQDFFAILVKLPFEIVEEENRKKIGLHSSDSIDNRKNWEPPLPKGMKTSTNQWHVYRAKWPKDGSDLSNKVIEIYLYEDCAFPVWIEVKAAAYKGKIRMIDQGKGLSSPVRIPS